MDTRGMLVWAAFLVVGAVIWLVSQRMKRQIEEHGIETVGVISRIEDAGEPDEVTLNYYARYAVGDGEEIEGLISNPSSGLVVGQQVRLKYHPKYKANARLV